MTHPRNLQPGPQQKKRASPHAAAERHSISTNQQHDTKAMHSPDKR